MIIINTKYFLKVKETPETIEILMTLKTLKQFDNH